MSPMATKHQSARFQLYPSQRISSAVKPPLRTITLDQIHHHAVQINHHINIYSRQ